MNPLAARLARRAKDTIRQIQGLSDTAASAPSPYLQWHGPSSGSEPGLVLTSVADILLLQGIAPVDAEVEIEFDGVDVELRVRHRFPHPSAPTTAPTCFEATVDASMTKGAKRCRLVAGDHVGDWLGVPTLPDPGSMVGAETLDRCPGCRSPEMIRAGRRQHLDMATCSRCGLVMTTPRPVEDHTLMRYSERYFVDEYLPSQQLSPSLTAHIDAILDHAEPAKSANNRLFELGVGGGNLANRATSRGWVVSGTDVNEASVAHAVDAGLNVWHENADHAESLGGTYGAVISEMSLEHVRRPDHFCFLAADALSPGGRLVIYTVSAEGESFEHAGMASPLAGPAEHLFLFSAGSLVSMCQRAGLRVDTVWRNPTADEIGIVAVKRRDVENPAVAPRADTA